MSAPRSAALAFLVALFAASASSSARADDLSDFERARASYDAQRYAEAVQKLELLVGGETPRLTTRAIILEARKYLGASYLFVARRADAERQFTLLLGDDPQYQLDPTTFPAEVREVFATVRARLEGEARERAAAHDREEAARRAEEAARLLRDADRLEQLRVLAETETFVEEHDRWIAALPFGIGQFQNGHTGLGIAFAVAEGALTATAITMASLHYALPSSTGYIDFEHPTLDMAEVRRLEAAYSVTNYLAMGVLAAVLVVGLVDAELRFVPSVTRTRPRAVAPAAQPETPSATLSVGPGSAIFRLRF